jgi:hypothetical protein
MGWRSHGPESGRGGPDRGVARKGLREGARLGSGSNGVRVRLRPGLHGGASGERALPRPGAGLERGSFSPNLYRSIHLLVHGSPDQLTNLTIMTYAKGTMPKVSTSGPATRVALAKQYTKVPKVPSPSSSMSRVPQEVLERKSRTTKAALVRAVAGNLQRFTTDELRSFKHLIESKRLKGKPGSIITAYLPDVAVGNIVVEVKLDDGSTWIGRVAARGRGRFVVVEATRRAIAPDSPSKPDVKVPAEAAHAALAHARTEYTSVRDSVVRQSLSLTQAARRMNLTTEGLSARVDRHEMLAFEEHNRKMVPVELIDDNEPDHTVRGLAEVIRAAEMEPFRLAVWLLNPARSLGETRPIDELRAGNVDRVVRAVRGAEAS